jgi:hypothetical protein
LRKNQKTYIHQINKQVTLTKSNNNYHRSTSGTTVPDAMSISMICPDLHLFQMHSILINGGQAVDMVVIIIWLSFEVLYSIKYPYRTHLIQFLTDE